MEIAVIDWKDSKFVKDELFEDINAPQWVDFSANDPPVDDEAWFCRPDCNHPKTVEDFIRQKTPNSSSKLQRSASVSDVPPLGDQNRRDGALKKRGLPLNKDAKSTKYVQDSENQNPNLVTPPNHKFRSLKEAIKSSAEKNETENALVQKEETPRRLKSTLSARNLFAGKDILNQITEFCNELKRLATRAKEREEEDKDIAKKSPLATRKQKGVLQERDTEKKPLLQVKKEKCEEMEKSSNGKEKLRRKKRNDESENSPIALNLKNVGGKDGNRLLQIRTNPPSPQCFSANRGPTKATPPKAFRPRLPERGILQQLEESKEEPAAGGNANASNQGRSTTPVLTEKEAAKTLDVFWFLKPCTFATS